MNTYSAQFVDYTTAQFLHEHCGRQLSAIPMQMQNERAKVKRDYRDLLVSRATEDLLDHFVEIKEPDETWVLAKCTDIRGCGETSLTMTVTICSTKDQKVCHITPVTELRVGGLS